MNVYVKPFFCVNDALFEILYSIFNFKAVLVFLKATTEINL